MMACVSAPYVSSICAIAKAQETYQAVRDDAFPSGTPYTRYLTRDSFGRNVTFYISGDQARVCRWLSLFLDRVRSFAERASASV